MKRATLAALTIGAGVGRVTVVLRHAADRMLRLNRGLAALQLAVRGGARYAGNAPRLFMLAGENRQQLRNDLALQTAEDVATTLGAMKGVLMKLGQMASYVDDGLPPEARRTLGRLQDSVPPMSAELAAGVIEEELGVPPERIFAEWDPEPIAAASIGQVHRAITRDGRAVAVKVQYPGIAETIAADLGNVSLLRRMLRIIAPRPGRRLPRSPSCASGSSRSWTTAARRATSSCSRSTTTATPPSVCRRSSASCPPAGWSPATWPPARVSPSWPTWSQHERDLAAETIYRFVFRSLYDMRAFNGDPHPGNYLFHGGGKVTLPRLRAGQALHPGGAAPAHGHGP